MDIVTSYQDLVNWLIAVTGSDHRLMHSNAGLIVLCVTRVVSRRRLESMVPLAAVIVAELANEVMDRLSAGSWRLPDTSSDVFVTLFWPLCLSIAAWARSSSLDALKSLSRPNRKTIVTLTQASAFNRVQAQRWTIAIFGTLLLLVAGFVDATGIGAQTIAEKREAADRDSQAVDKMTYLARAEKRFEKLDVDKDGVISTMEARARHPKPSCTCTAK